METKKIAYYPGCSLEGTARSFSTSTRMVLRELGVVLEELDDWNCCGASSAHAVSHDLHLSLNLRNLALAEKQGFGEILAPCAACYHRLASTNLALRKDGGHREELCRSAKLTYTGTVTVRNLLDLFVNGIGMQPIAARVRRPLTGLKVVAYYGCLNTRLMRGTAFDSVENPTAMDRLTSALGARSLDWSSKTECCGGSFFVSAQETALRMTGKILADAVARGADCIVTSCPMCHNNLDSKQQQVVASIPDGRCVPVVFITQLMGLAFDMKESDLGLHQAMVPFLGLERLTRAPVRLQAAAKEPALAGA